MSAAFGFVAEAAEELELHRDYYERKAPGVGARFLIAAHDAIMAAIDMPNAGALVAAGARARRIARFPIRIIYVVRGDRLIVVAVAHGARRPGYWADRLE